MTDTGFTLGAVAAHIAEDTELSAAFISIDSNVTIGITVSVAISIAISIAVRIAVRIAVGIHVAVAVCITVAIGGLFATTQSQCHGQDKQDSEKKS